MERYVILEIYHLPSGNDMASAVIVRDDDRTLKYNVLLQSKPNPGNDGKKPFRAEGLKGQRGRSP